jgi:MSHA pilin protein MshA
MNTSHIRSNRAQAGFTLIELIVVIVILGILAATALPKFADLSGDARVAKMQGAAGAIKSAAAITHAQWLVKGSPVGTASNSTSTNSTLIQEGAFIAFINGYPDVGGDGVTNAATVAANSGVAVAAGGLTADYTLTATATVLTVAADSTHPNCKITYTEPASAGAAPVIDVSALATASNCN